MLNPNATIELNLPPHHEGHVRADLRRLKPYIPDWVRIIRVDYKKYDDDDGATNADIIVEYKYRAIYITLYNNYMAMEGRDKLETLIHEIGHAHMAPLTCAFKEIMDFVKDNYDDRVAELMDRIRSFGEEPAVESFTHGLVDLLRAYEESKYPLVAIKAGITP